MPRGICCCKENYIQWWLMSTPKKESSSIKTNRNKISNRVSDPNYWEEESSLWIKYMDTSEQRRWITTIWLWLRWIVWRGSKSWQLGWAWLPNLDQRRTWISTPKPVLNTPNQSSSNCIWSWNISRTSWKHSILIRLNLCVFSSMLFWILKSSKLSSIRSLKVVNTSSTS